MPTSNCPGLLHIVPARDGGICRLRLPGGSLHAAQADALALATEQHATGPIDLTNRANLQVRGVRHGHETAFSTALIAAGLGPGGQCDLDLHTATALDTVRNLMISPVAGRDPAALIDTRPIAQAMLDALMAEPRFAQLSPKFALLLDGGERLAARTHPHDIWLAAVPAADGAPLLAFGLAGCPPGDTQQAWRNTPPLGAVPPVQAPALVQALLHAFLDLAQAGQQRMRDLLQTHTPAQLLLRAGQKAAIPPHAPDWPASDPMLRFGAHPQRDGQLFWVGAQPPLGRISPAALRALAQLARDVSASATLHITPWQGVLLPDVAPQNIHYAQAALLRLGFACQGNEPLARMIACTGSQGCARALADVKSDALALSQLLDEAQDIHLSGCMRSCAAAHPSAHTLLAVAPGRYDLYQRDDGPDFGTCIAREVSITEAALKMTAASRSTPDV